MDGFHYIRAAAAKVLDEFRHKTGTEPFDAEGGTHLRLAAIAAGVYRLSVAPDYRLPSGTLGRLDPDAGVIGHAPDLQTTDRDFTIAHEIGHRALEHAGGAFLDRAEDLDQAPDHGALGVQNGVYRGYSKKSRKELEANVFAAELLAPVALVRDRISNDGDWTIEGLASYFGLSKTAMLNQIAAAILPLPEEEDEVREPGPSIEDHSHEVAIGIPSPAYVQAGPGAGKTRVLVERYGRLVREGNDPRHILALTFANKAAAEMRERIARTLNEVRPEQIVVTTFHSYGLDLIRQYRKVLGFAAEPRLLTPTDVLTLLRPKLAEMPLGAFESVSSPASRLGPLLDAISRAKDELIEPDEFAAKALEWEGELLSRPTPADAKAATKLEADREHAAKCRQAADFYRAYEELLRSENAIDYGDLIRYAVRILEDAEAGDEIRSGVSHLLVDEFQDVNYASGRMVQALDGGRGVVWAVGDARQSIYRFRGASPANLIRFEERFPGARPAPLGRNYRSVQDVVVCGTTVPITDPFTGELLPHLDVEAFRGRPTGQAAIKLVEEASRGAEMEFVLSQIKLELAQNLAEKDIAVLCRSRADAQAISDFLELGGVATSWEGDPLSSAAFKDALAMVALAAGDLRGLPRLGSLDEHRIGSEDLALLLDWRRSERAGAVTLLKAARDGSVKGLSESARQSCGRLLILAQSLGAHRTVYLGLADYLFGQSMWFRSVISDDSPRAMRAAASVRQLLALARTHLNAPQVEGESAARNFLSFVEMAVQVGRLDVVAPELSAPRRVNVMTVHASKGLEWPVVYVPFLNDGKFPSYKTGERTPIPGRFARDGDVVDESAEEACLFFVAVTRARDRLILTRAPHGSRKKRSRYLEPIIETLAARGFLDHRTQPVPEEAKSKDLLEIQEPERVFEYTDLAAYGECPKRFEFERVLGLSGGDRGYVQYHAAVAAAVDRLVAIADEERELGEGAVAAALDESWIAQGLLGHFYEPRLRQLAEGALHSAAARISKGDRPRKAAELVVDAGGRLVRVKVDEFRSGPPAVYRRVHLTGPSKSHLGKDDDDRHALYAMHANATAGGDWSIEAYYPALSIVRPSLVQSGSESRLLTERKKRMHKLSAGVLSQTYPPTGDDRTCRRCPFAIVCPRGTSEADS